MTFSTIRHLIFSLLAPALILSSSAFALDVKLSQYSLDNGMKVIVIPDHRSQIVTHSVWYKVGAADEVSGKTGLAHFLEHVMFKGTVKHPYGDFDHIIDLNGAYSNAFTTEDNTTYYQQTTADRLPLMMEIEADRMQNLVLTDEIVKPELDVVREERRTRTDNDPQAQLREQTDAVMFSAHPYGRPTIGWMSEVAKLTKDDALDFYHRYYTPANATLIVAGDVDPAKVFDLAKTYYGVLKNTFVPTERERTEEPGSIVARRITMTDARAASPALVRSYLTPSYRTNNDQAVSLDFLTQILGNGVKSKLNQKLVMEQKLAVYAVAYFQDDRDYGRLTVYAAPNPGVDVAKLEAAVDAALADVLKNGVSQDDLNRSRKQAMAEQIYSLDSQMALINIVGSAVINEQDVSKAFDTSEWDKVTPDSISKVAKQYLRPENSVTAILLPEAKQ